MNAKQVAGIILSQLKAGGPIIMMSWGCERFTCGTNEYQNHFLEFKVNGFLHKGQVRVTLEGNDTYTITLYKGKDRKVVAENKGIYCDQLTDVVDGMVERAPSDTKETYGAKVNKAVYRI